MSPCIAEMLLDLANSVRHPKELMIVMPESPEHHFARIRLALDLLDHPGVAFRAIAEEWDYLRIVKELN